jgi:TolB protein
VYRLFLPLAVLLAALAAGCGGSEPAGAESEIAFVTSRDGDYAIYGMRADGSGQGRLTRDDAGEGPRPTDAFFQVEPDWSPDGKKIAFASRRDGPSHVYVMNADGSGTTQLTSGKHQDAGPSWAPDGKRIAFVRDGQLYVMSSTGGDPHKLTDATGGEDGEPAWSPDGSRLAYVRRLPGYATREIWLANAEGKERVRLTRLDAATYGPAWSPDGRRIVFTSNAQDDRYQLYEIGVDGKGLDRLTFQPGEYFDPSWSPDGKTLIFERDGIVYTRGDGGVETALTDGPNDGSPAWRPVVPAASS